MSTHRFSQTFIGLILLFVQPLAALAQGPFNKSAKRERGMPYEMYVERMRLFSQGEERLLEQNRTPVDVAEVFEAAHLAPVTLWENDQALKARFAALRDMRFLVESSRPEFPRRSSWLYPDDGCFARAALAIRNLARLNVPLPNKVFAFGDLEVKTANTPDGSVSWWYHVAPIVQVGEEKFVLDPAIEPREPLRLADWLARMSSRPGRLKVAICGTGAYTPDSPCLRASDEKEELAEQDQQEYLRDEWRRLVDLRRNPERELGNYPPWKGKKRVRSAALSNEILTDDFGIPLVN